MNSSRRDFIKTALVGSAALSLASTPATFAGSTSDSKPVLRPKKLQQGSTIAIVAPATNAWEDEDIRYAIEIVESLGFKTKPGKHLFDRHGYLAGQDADRAADLMRMFTDPDVDGIFCLRGGYGSPRILSMLDYQQIAKHPKFIMGYSDITALLNAIHAQTGLITFHGPIARQGYSDYTLAEFQKVAHGQATPYSIGAPPPFEAKPGKVQSDHRITTIQQGKARGHLVGGNLTLFTDLLGTLYLPDLKGAILFLEDVNEQPYRIDAMLTQMWNGGHLQQCAGIVLAKFTDCKPENPPSMPLEAIFKDRIKPLGIPCYRGMLSGHVSDQTVVPIGCQAEIDADAGTLTLVTSPVA